MTNYASCSLFVLVVDRCLWSLTLNNSKKHLGYKVRSFPFKLQESTGRCICYILTVFFFFSLPTTTTVSTVSYLFAALFCCSCCNLHKRFVIVKMHVHVFAHARYTLSLFSCLLLWQTRCYRVIELWCDNSWVRSLLMHYPIKIYRRQYYFLKDISIYITVHCIHKEVSFTVYDSQYFYSSVFLV